jgi:hypothetical protein
MVFFVRARSVGVCSREDRLRLWIRYGHLRWGLMLLAEFALEIPFTLRVGNTSAERLAILAYLVKNGKFV